MMDFASKTAKQAYKELTQECGRISADALAAVKDLGPSEKALATMAALRMQFDMMAEAVRIASNIEIQNTQIAVQGTLLDRAMGGMIMGSKNKITIPITQDRYLVYRTTEISKTILLVERTEDEGSLIATTGTEQAVLATSPVGCVALANALQDMAKKIRELNIEGTL